MACRVKGAAGGEGSNWGLEGAGSGEARQDNTVESLSLGGPCAEANRARKRNRAKLGLRRRRWSGEDGEPIAGGRAVVRPRWGVACQHRWLALRASGTEGQGMCLRVPIAWEGQGSSVAGTGGGADHMRYWHRSMVCPKVIVRQG